jgi:hypothetical protein
MDRQRGTISYVRTRNHRPSKARDVIVTTNADRPQRVVKLHQVADFLNHKFLFSGCAPTFRRAVRTVSKRMGVPREEARAAIRMLNDYPELDMVVGPQWVGSRRPVTVRRGVPR